MNKRALATDWAMLHGLYVSSQGAQARASQLDVVANNIANAGTTGFKRNLALFRSFESFDREQGSSSQLVGNVDRQSGGTGVALTATDSSQGSLVKTDGPMDLAISGSGFFRVTNGTNESLTRDGNFTTNARGELITVNGGEKLLSTTGIPLVLNPAAGPISIGTDGMISQQSPTGEQLGIGQIDLVQPVDVNSLERMGGNKFRTAGATQPAPLSTRISQGYVEASGVNPVLETMQMIEASRAFETNINMMKFQDESLGRLLTASRP